MSSVLWRADVVVTPAGDADALVTDGGRITWVGRYDDVPGDVERTEDLRGAVIAPAFVDGHVHVTDTGVTLDGLDLHDATSLADALDRVAAYARARPGLAVRGTGWDESTWPERRAPTAAELDRAADGAVVYLSRADVHSAVVSTALLAKCAFGDAAGVLPDGLVRLDAHHVARHVVNATRTPDEVERAQRCALAEAARLGIGAVTEMAGPEIAGLADLEALLALRADADTVHVEAYWGALGDVDTPLRLGLVGAGGDLFCDGSIGSHTAALHAPYADADTQGHVRFGHEELVAHIVAATRAGLQSGFHVIGDAAVDAVLAAYSAAAEAVGRDVLRASRHRLEHVEMADAAAVRRMADLGITASVQPAFDATWGGADLMYAERLGPSRGTALNPYAAMVDAGVLLAFGSDAPVTALDPWGGVRAAVRHRTPSSRVDVRSAFHAATTAGHRAVGRDDEGHLVAGNVATFAVWAAGDDAAWWRSLSRPGAPGVPGADELPDDAPQCLRTVVAGRTVTSQGQL